MAYKKDELYDDKVTAELQNHYQEILRRVRAHSTES